MANKLRIAYLKRRAKKLYLEIERNASRFDCGAALSEHISPGLAKAREEFESTMVELKELDPKLKKISGEKDEINGI